MKYYERRLVWSMLWLVGGLFFFLQGILQFQRRYYGLALLPVFVALLFLFDAYIYRRPYLGLGEGKIVINNGLIRKEVMLADITMLNQTGKSLDLTYNQGSLLKKQKIELTMLKKSDREEFVRDLHLALGK